MKRLVIRMRTEVSDANNNCKYLTVDFDIEVNFTFLLVSTAHIIDVVMPFCSAPQEQCHLLQQQPQQQPS